MQVRKASCIFHYKITLIFLLQDEMADQLFLQMAIHLSKVYRITSLSLEEAHLDS